MLISNQLSLISYFDESISVLRLLAIDWLCAICWLSICLLTISLAWLAVCSLLTISWWSVGLLLSVAVGALSSSCDNDLCWHLLVHHHLLSVHHLLLHATSSSGTNCH